MRLLRYCSLFLLVAAFGVPARACVGARALAMGGAFVGLADDVSATYWNPAGLLALPQGRGAATLMHTTTNRETINYQDYLAYVARRGTDSAWGVSYLRFHLGEDPGAGLSWYQDWLWASWAHKVGTGATFGLNLRLTLDDVSLDGEDVSDLADTGPGLDLAWLQQINPTTSLGVLIQNANEPKTSLAGETLGEWVRNVRPGIAVRPTPDTVVTVELYDALDHGGGQAIRAGAEVWLGDVALRGGWYGNADAPTGGLGFRGSGIALDAAVMMGDLDNTLLVSATVSF